MSIGSEMAYRRSARGKEATGSLVFDAERKRARKKSEETSGKGKAKEAKAKH